MIDKENDRLAGRSFLMLIFIAYRLVLFCLSVPLRNIMRPLRLVFCDLQVMFDLTLG